MVVMALDHSRDFLTNTTFDPIDLTQTTALLFLTRWITHFCAPVFILLAGAGAGLSLAGGKTPGQLARFLLTRGLWLVFLELAVVSPIGWSFNLGFDFTRLQVIWVIGLSMVILAGLVTWVPRRGLAVLGVVLIFGHNLFDGPHAAWLGGLAPVWRALHNISGFHPLPHKAVVSLYPIIPWLGVMALGYGASEIMRLEAGRRNRILLWTGLAMIAVFLILRGVNLYGDPRPWGPQPSGLFSLLSFVNTSKYPPSLDYLMMTLGPALCFLAVADRLPAALSRPLGG